MTVYGITRASTRKQQASPEVQAEMIRKHCAAVQLPEPTILDEPLGTSGRSTDFRHRPQGRWLLLHAQPGDVLVVTKLDRLGRTAQGHPRHAGAVRQAGRAGDRDSIPRRPEHRHGQHRGAVGGHLLRRTGPIRGRHDRRADLRVASVAPAARAGLQPRRLRHTQGRQAAASGTCEQLAYIAEIAERLGKGEDVLLVVADFWGRGIKDHRGLPWGQVQHKEGKGTGNGFEWYLAGHALVSPHEARRQAAPALLRHGPHDPRTPAVHRGKAPQASQRQTRHRRKSRLDRRAVAGVVCLGVREELSAVIHAESLW